MSAPKDPYRDLKRAAARRRYRRDVDAADALAYAMQARGNQSGKSILGLLDFAAELHPIWHDERPPEDPPTPASQAGIVEMAPQRDGSWAPDPDPSALTLGKLLHAKRRLDGER